MLAEVDLYRHCAVDLEDWDFLRGLTHHAPADVLPAIFCAYLATWRHAAMLEPSPARKENAGRYAGNCRMRVDAAKMERGDKDTMRIYARLVREGPRVACATCQHCDTVGGCRKGLPMVGSECPEWRADFK